MYFVCSYLDCFQKVKLFLVNYAVMPSAGIKLVKARSLSILDDLKRYKNGLKTEGSNHYDVLPVP